MPPSWKSYQHAPSCSFGWNPPYSQFCNVPFDSTSRRRRLDGTNTAVDCHLHAHRKWQVSSLQVPQLQECKLTEDDLSWCLDDQSFEKNGYHNGWKPWKTYWFIWPTCHVLISNVFRSKGLSDSHEVAVFLQLYGTSSWIKKGKSMSLFHSSV